MLPPADAIMEMCREVTGSQTALSRVPGRLVVRLIRIPNLLRMFAAPVLEQVYYMRQVGVKEEEADFLVGAEKTVEAPIVWALVNSRRQRYRFRVRVIGIHIDMELWLAGQANPDNWSFVLLGPGNVRLRKISSPHRRHLHPNGSEAPPRHKHYWTEADEDHWTYEPNDIRWDN